jgi:deoxyadenosine/deoxycytidine kinase/ribonuclease HI
MNNTNTNNQKIFTIEGNIGSGKSTFVKHLKEYYKNNNSIYFLDEPVEEWNEIKDESNKNMIEKYYENQTRYAFAFQMMAYITRITKLQKALNDGYNIIITERCIYTDKNVFAKMLYDENKIENVEYIIYNKWFEEFTANIPDIKVIYIKTKPEIAKERINFRNRKGEENIPLEYLQKCDIYHTSWVNNIKVGDKLILDGNTNINENPEYNNTLLSVTDNFIWNKNNDNKNITGNIEEYILMFDGASRGNPGLSGCGFVIYDSKNTVIYKGSKFLNVQTNNYAEYMALIIGLEMSLKLGIKKLIVKGDSLLIIKQMKDLYNVKSDNLKNLNKQATTLAKNISNIEYIFVRREFNVEADKLANLIIDLNCDNGAIEITENKLNYKVASY